VVPQILRAEHPGVDSSLFPISYEHYSGCVTDLPSLTDGTVTIRSRHDDGVAVTGEDQQIFSFDIEHLSKVVGMCEICPTDASTGDLIWALFSEHRGQGLATRSVRILSDWAMTATSQGGLGLTRVEARIEPRNEAALRVATRAGLHREGVRRVVAGIGARPEVTEFVILAKLSTDPPLSDPKSFRALLNSFLPRKRAISQMLVTDQRGHVLLCELTYKQDWDLPGGVVEVGESPQRAVSREVTEELGLRIVAGPLLLTDWLPSWGGWDDAICLVFDGGVHSTDLLGGLMLQQREINAAEFCSLEQIREKAADFTARRIEAALMNLHSAHLGYSESGRAV
jgi:8-oxo-dGTP pyrophosphatase MutT (NUDIX family)